MEPTAFIPVAAPLAAAAPRAGAYSAARAASVPQGADTAPSGGARACLWLGAAAALSSASTASSRRRARAAGRHGPVRTQRQFFGNIFGGEPEAAAEGAAEAPKAAAEDSSDAKWRQLAELNLLGAPPFEKALKVNLDPNFYGSFAEIGAGQEVSRTFLTAGAAAGTVARSISAYDMKMSDVSYGKSSRYVTKERLLQMLDTEYQTVEDTLREQRGPDCRFFSFATTLAAKAYMSDRECEGWIGLKFQAEPGAPCSTVSLHVRMSDPTAQQQGTAIGIVGTNLLYLCHTVSDPHLIASFLLDGLGSDEGEGRRIEVDVIDFDGPAFPSVDARLLAYHMVQARLANAVLMEPDEKTGEYRQAVPNTALYKKPVIVERSRFTPVTNMHRGLQTASKRYIEASASEDSREPVQLLNMQIDDLTDAPVQHMESQARLRRAQALAASAKGGRLSEAEFKALVAGRLTDEETTVLFQELGSNSGSVSLDDLISILSSKDNLLNSEFLDRFEMLEPLNFPVLVSSIQRTHKLANYLQRYTKQEIVIAVGGGDFQIERALFRPAMYERSRGGMLEAFGRLFNPKSNVKIFIYPNIDADGNVTLATPENVDLGEEQLLYEYLVGKGYVVPLTEEAMSDRAKDAASNKYLRLSSQDVQEMIAKGSSDWEEYVPSAVRDTVKSRKWFDRLTKGTSFSLAAYKFLNEL